MEHPGLNFALGNEIDALRDWARYRARPATGEV